MSKRTTASRSSPSPHRFHKKQKTAGSSVVSTSPPLNDMIVDPPGSPEAGGLHGHMIAKNAQSDTKGMDNGTVHAKERSRSPKAKPKPATHKDSAASNGWTKVENKREKRAKKGALKVTNQPPSFMFNVQELVKMGAVSISVSCIPN
jgi:hypothetical protein